MNDGLKSRSIILAIGGTLIVDLIAYDVPLSKEELRMYLEQFMQAIMDVGPPKNTDG